MQPHIRLDAVNPIHLPFIIPTQLVATSWPYLQYRPRSLGNEAGKRGRELVGEKSGPESEPKVAKYAVPDGGLSGYGGGT